MKTWSQAILVSLALTGPGLRAAGSVKIMPCAETSRLSLVRFSCPRNRGRYRLDLEQVRKAVFRPLKTKEKAS